VLFHEISSKNGMLQPRAAALRERWNMSESRRHCTGSHAHTSSRAVSYGEISSGFIHCGKLSQSEKNLLAALTSVLFGKEIHRHCCADRNYESANPGLRKLLGVMRAEVASDYCSGSGHKRLRPVDRPRDD